MKILAIGRPKDPLLAISPLMMKQLLEPSIATMKKQKAQGTILASYYSPPKNCSITILNYDNAEDWMKDLMDIPIMSFYDQEIYPLVDMEDAAKEMIKKLKAAG